MLWSVRTSLCIFGIYIYISLLDVAESESIRTLTVLDTWIKSGHQMQPKQSSKFIVSCFFTLVLRRVETIRMSWADALNVFDGMYLSWDPSRWSQALTFHGRVHPFYQPLNYYWLSIRRMWNRSGYDEESRLLRWCGLYYLTHLLASTRHLYLSFNKTETSEEVWILLTRHVVDSSRSSEFISLKVEIEDELRSYSKTADQSTIASKVRELLYESP